MSLSANFPTIRPSLLLDFANTQTLDPRITFTRASTATYYDGVTTAKAEENLLLQSQDFTNASWTKQATSATGNTEVAPDGTTTAETITLTAGGGIHAVLQTASALSGGRVASLFVKAGTHRYVQLSFNGDSTPWANFDVFAGAGAVGSTGTNQTASIVDAGNGWYRCVLYTSSTTATNFYVTFVDSGSSARQQSWTAAGTETVYLWGAQLEQRSAVTAYTATTTQPITNYIPVLQTAAANVARFDHNPTTGESLGLLIEEQRTNLLTYSEQFDNAAWTKTRSSITANTIVAPDGTLTGDKMVEDTTASNTHQVFQPVSFTASTTYTASVFVKAAERTQIGFRSGNAAFTTPPNILFDLASLTVTVLAGSVSGTINSVGNGWYRCSATVTANSTASDNCIWNLGAGGTNIYTGDGYSGIYIWGAQLEAGAFPTSYIATTSASVTRTIDAASMTGTNFSGWYRQDQGTLMANASGAVSTTYQVRVLSVNDGTANNRADISLNATSGVSLFTVTTGGVSQAQLIGAAVTSSTTFNYAGAYSANDFAGSLNGATVQTDTSGTVPPVTQMSLGGWPGVSGNLNGHIKRIAYYPQRLTNAQLQALTS
jgi:hypothetical protein